MTESGRSESDRRVRNVVIVGGGTAGWMTALSIKRLVGGEHREVTLIESQNIGTIGVGEATVPPLTTFLREMDIDENEFMRRCHATYKLGIRFSEWNQAYPSFFHPFGSVGDHVLGLPFLHYWAELSRREITKLPFEQFSINWLASEEMRAPHQGSTMARRGAYAYHIDAGAFGDYLREIAVEKGVRRLEDDVVDVRLDGSGAIATLCTHSGREVKGDFFIDCSGFRGLLIEGAMKDPWVDWSDELLCDRAVAMPLQHDGKYPPYTLATAREAGWTWRIPLSHRIGSGYVFSSRHCNDDSALNTLMAASGDSASFADPFFLKMRVGRRKEFWVRNCLSIGLSGGFLEPLESTGIYLIQAAISWLRHYFPDIDMDPVLASRFNKRMGEIFDEVRDFIVLHYLLSNRPDDPFWQDACSVSISPKLQELLEVYDHTGMVDIDNRAFFGDVNYYAILAGQGRLPKRMLPRAALLDFAINENILQKVQARQQRLLAEMPSHIEVLEALHGAGTNTPPEKATGILSRLKTGWSTIWTID